MAHMVINNDIVTGYSKLNTLLTFSRENLKDWKSKPEYALEIITRNTFQLNDFGFFEATYTDLILTGIPRNILDNNEFDNYTDVGFCWDITHLGYNIFVDPKIFVPMIDNSPVRQFTDNPVLLLEKRQVDIDAFMK
jgi:hypothetical protein